MIYWGSQGLIGRWTTNANIINSLWCTCDMPRVCWALFLLERIWKLYAQRANGRQIFRNKSHAKCLSIHLKYWTGLQVAVLIKCELSVWISNIHLFGITTSFLSLRTIWVNYNDHNDYFNLYCKTSFLLNISAWMTHYWHAICFRS